MEKVSNGYRNYVLAMLTIVYIFNFIDRQILVILQESIKADLQLSDTQLGLLSGFTFAIFYVTMGIPIARYADSNNRKNIVSVSLALWSAMTALSGFAQNFLQLLLARIGVGVGEAGGSPPAHAMISDYFPPEKRATALSVYSMGIYFGILIGFLMGGYLNESFGWRNAFLLVGIPGILFAVVFYFTVKEPIRGASDRKKTAKGLRYSLRAVLGVLFSKKAFIYLALATALSAFCNYGIGNWMPSFLARVHKMPIVEIGTWLGLIIGVGGGIGTFIGGYMADYLGKNDKKWYFKISAYSILVSLPFIIGAFFLNNTTAVLVSLGIAVVLTSTYLGPSIAITHSLVPPEMRAFSSAILFFVLNLIGLGLGPLVVGMVSDLLAPSIGTESLRWALVITVPVIILAMVLYFGGAKRIEGDLQG